MKKVRKLFAIMIISTIVLTACGTSLDPNVTEDSDEQVEPGEMNPHHGE